MSNIPSSPQVPPLISPSSSPTNFAGYTVISVQTPSTPLTPLTPTTFASQLDPFYNNTSISTEGPIGDYT